MSSPTMLTNVAQFAGQAASASLLDQYGIGVVPYAVNEREIEFKPLGTELPPLEPVIVIDGSHQSYDSIPGISLSKKGAGYQRHFFNSWDHFQNVLGSKSGEYFSDIPSRDLRGGEGERYRRLSEEYASYTVRELAGMSNEEGARKDLEELAWLFFDNGNRTYDPGDYGNYLVSAIVFANLGDERSALVAEAGFLIAARAYSKSGYQNPNGELAMLYELAGGMRKRHMVGSGVINPYHRSAARYWAVDADEGRKPKDPQSILLRMFRSMWHAAAGGGVGILAEQFNTYADHLMNTGRGEAAAKMRVATVWAGFQVFEGERDITSLWTLSSRLNAAVSDCRDMGLSELANEMAEVHSKVEEFIASHC